MRKELNKTKEYISNELEKMVKEIVLITKDKSEEKSDNILNIQKYVDNIEKEKGKVNIINKIKIGNYIKNKTSEILKSEFIKLDKYEKRKMLKIIDLITII